MHAAQAISSFLGKAPGQLPDIVRGLVDQVWLHSQVTCTVDVSPPSLGTAEPVDCTFVIGGAARNAHRRHFVTHEVPAALLENELDIGTRIRSDQVRQVIINRTNGDHQVVQSEQGIAVVETAFIPGRRCAIFFCLGARADGSWIAAEYLVRNWRSLERVAVRAGSGSPRRRR